MPTQDLDARLMLRVRDDEPGAFDQLVHKYQPRLLWRLRRLLGNAQDAEDLSQEVFLRVYLARKRYQARFRFSTWLFTIGRNLAVNAIISRRLRRALPFSEQLICAWAVPPLGRMQQEELASLIGLAIDGLNSQQRTAVLLNKYQGQSYAEVAAAMKLSTQAVKSLLSRARANLRAALQDYVD